MRSKRAWLRLTAALLASLMTATVAHAQDPALVRPYVQYAEVAGERLFLDVYFSPLPGERPVLMLIHGGSWRRRDKSDWAELAPRFVEAGYTVLVPNYRLAPPGGGWLFPAPVDDLAIALEWARDNAADYHGDPTRVGMLGTSAGGHLALMRAVSGHDRPEAVAAYSPPVSLRRLYGQGVLWHAIQNFLGCTPAECAGTYRAASPLTGVDRRSPPVFMAYSAGEKIPSGQGRLMSERLSNAGVPSTLVVQRGKAHGLALARKVLDETIAFFDQRL